MTQLMKLNKPIATNVVLDHTLAEYRQENAGDSFVIFELATAAFGRLLTLIGNVHFMMVTSNVDKGRREVSDARGYLKKLDSVKDRINFVTLRELVVPVPEGFGSDYAAYVQLLDSTRQSTFTAANQFLSEFQIYASTFVSDKATKISNKSLEADFKKVRKAREDNEAKVQSFFTNGSAQRAKFGKLFENPHDVLPGLTQAVNNWEACLKSDQLKATKSIVENLTRTLTLVEEIQRSSGKTEVSKAAILNLAQGAREAAEEIEAIGKVFARAEIASVSASYIAERLAQHTK